MDVPLVIRRRLEELGVEQRQLATAAQVTESYISQLLTRKKAPPAPLRRQADSDRLTAAASCTLLILPSRCSASRISLSYRSSAMAENCYKR